MRLILASASARRKELLGWLGIPFTVQESGFDEERIEADDPETLARTLALAKAQTVVDKVRATLPPKVQLEKELTPPRHEPMYVLGGDLLIVIEGEILGKPRDLSHAREMLLKMKGKTHEVYTGVAIVDVWTGKHKEVVEKSSVTFRNFSDQVLEDYVNSSEPLLHNAGAYMIQGKGKVLVEKFEGSLTNIIGLPLHRVAELLEEFGIKVPVDVAETIRRKTGYAT